MGPSPDRLFFFSGSADVYPGKGEQEHVNDRTQYTELAQIKNWRQILSNLHVAPFKYSDGEFPMHSSWVLLPSVQGFPGVSTHSTRSLILIPTPKRGGLMQVCMAKIVPVL